MKNNTPHLDMQPLEIKKNDWNPITQQKMLEYKVQNTK